MANLRCDVHQTHSCIDIAFLLCQSQVEKVLLDKKLDKEYAGIMGDPKFRKVATELALGVDSKALLDNRV